MPCGPGNTEADDGGPCGAVDMGVPRRDFRRRGPRRHGNGKGVGADTPEQPEILGGENFYSNCYLSARRWAYLVQSMLVKRHAAGREVVGTRANRSKVRDAQRSRIKTLFFLFMRDGLAVEWGKGHSGPGLCARGCFCGSRERSKGIAAECARSPGRGYSMKQKTINGSPAGPLRQECRLLTLRLDSLSDPVSDSRRRPRLSFATRGSSFTAARESPFARRLATAG